jgi:hypothetical protein
MGENLNITLNLAFIHRRSQVNSDHRDRRTSAQIVIVLIRNSKGLSNQRPFLESLQPAEFGQSISVPLKKHLNGDHSLASDEFGHGRPQDLGFELQNKVNEKASFWISSWCALNRTIGK